MKRPIDAGMLLSINGETFFSFTKNTWIGDLDASCHITNNDTGLYDITNINKLVWGSSDGMSAMKKGKPHIKICQVEGSEKLHLLWSINIAPKLA